MKLDTLDRDQLRHSKAPNFSVSFVWTKELQKLVKENDSLLEQNTALKTQVHRLEEELAQLKGVMEYSSFVRLYA